jgi:hypothetical protein
MGATDVHSGQIDRKDASPPGRSIYDRHPRSPPHVCPEPDQQECDRERPEVALKGQESGNHALREQGSRHEHR